MKLCWIFRVDGEYAVKFFISTSHHAVARYMSDNGHSGYPWTETRIFTDEGEHAPDDAYHITEVKQIMADVGDEAYEIGGYIE